MVPLAFRYCEVGKGVVSEFDKSVLTNMCEPLMPIFEGRCFRMECFCKECGSIGGGIWDPPTEAIDDSTMNIELLIADSTSFMVDCYSVASQCKLHERHKTCLEMQYMKNSL